MLVLVFVPALVASLRWFPLSRLSWTLILLFLSLHTIGAHYTYAEVPYDALEQSPPRRARRRSPGARAEPFRPAGPLQLRPADGLSDARAVLARRRCLRGFWGYFLPLDLTLSTSAIFELFEWAAAEIFGGDLGVAYLGTQGDMWDAQKDWPWRAWAPRSP